MRLPWLQISDAIKDRLTSAGAPGIWAANISDEVMYAEVSGRQTHGFDMLEAMLTRTERTCEIPLVEDNVSSAGLVVEAKGHPGPVVAAAAVDGARRAADEHGIGVAAARSASTFLAAGYHPYQLALTGRYATIAVSVAKARVAPIGARRAVLGTNPLAIGAPSTHGPLVIDIAMTPLPAAEVRRRAKTGEPLPPGLAVDSEGEPTTDAAAATEGAIFPFGGYKGSGLAVLIEALAGGLLGVKCGLRHGDLRGMVFIVIKADLWASADTVSSAIGDLIEDITSSPPLGGEPPAAPGLRTHRAITTALTYGVELQPSRLAKLTALGVDLPSSR